MKKENLSFRDLIFKTGHTGKSLTVDLKISVSHLERSLTLSKTVFDQVTVPCLVHWDLWDGNVFVKDNRITGVIDCERSLWGDRRWGSGMNRNIRQLAFTNLILPPAVTDVNPLEPQKTLTYPAFFPPPQKMQSEKQWARSSLLPGSRRFPASPQSRCYWS